MPLPQVVIVGRPNVGKSSLFNWIAGRRIAIVDPTAGVTRDRLAAPVAVGDRYFEIMDTGGMGIQDRDQLTDEVEDQITLAIDQADLILFVVDARSGPMALDDIVARRLRGMQKPVMLVANKCDSEDIEPQAAEFHRFGFGEILLVSAKQNRNKEALLEKILGMLPKEGSITPPGEVKLKIAIVGKRNTGKSTFINCLAESPRTIVSEVAGTTRDSVDVQFERDGQTFIAIDTAGVRNKGKIKDDIEFYSLHRAERSIRRADVVLHFFDATHKISHVDKQLASYILENYKPAIFVANKWDLTLEAEMATGEYAEYLRKNFPNLDHVPIAFITAKDGKNVQRLLNLAQSLFKQASHRVGTGIINRVIQKAFEDTPPVNRQGRFAKVYYATQVAILPPTIVLFTNGPQLFDKTYRRYLMKALYDALPFNDVAIKMYLRAKERKEDAEADVAPKKPRKTPRSKKKSGELWTDV